MSQTCSESAGYTVTALFSLSEGLGPGDPIFPKNKQLRDSFQIAGQLDADDLTLKRTLDTQGAHQRTSLRGGYTRKNEHEFGTYRDVASRSVDEYFEHRTDGHGTVKKRAGDFPGQQRLAGDSGGAFDRLRCPIQVLIERASNQDGRRLRTSRDSQIL